MTVYAKWMQTLTVMSLLLIVISNSNYAATAMPTGGTNYPRNKSAINIIRSDKMVIDKRNIFCITSFADESTIELVKRSGEQMESWTVGSFANNTAIAMITALLGAGFSTSTTPGRVVVDNILQRRDNCNKNVSTIFVSISIESLSASKGYRISVSAKQGKRRYIARIDRSMLIYMSMELREGIPWNAEASYDGRPFWDVSHDIFKLQENLIDHLFHDDRSRHM